MQYLCLLRCLILLALIFSSCARPPRLHCWFVDSLVKVFPGDGPGAREAPRGSWLVPRNGHTSIQIALRSARPLPALRVELRAPEFGGDRLEVQARWVDYVPVGSNTPGTPDDELVRYAPALFPDPLKEDFPFDLKPGRTQPVWITVHAPTRARPGEYHGEATFYSGETRLRALPFKVRVVEAAVPQEQKLQVTNWFNWDGPFLRRFYRVEEYSDGYWELLENIGRVMAQHKQNVILTPVESLVIPTLSGGSIRYEFSRFDRWVETFQKAGVIGAIEGGHLLSRSGGFQDPLVVPAYVVEDGRIVFKNLDPDDPRAARFMHSFLSALYAHLKEKGWVDRYIQHIHDEPHGRENPVYERYGKIIRQNLPGIETIDAVGLDQKIDYFAAVCDIWVPVLGSFDHKLDLIRAHVNKGGKAWFYTCVFPQGRYLNRFIDLPLLKVRLLHWFNFRHGFTGFLHWGGNYWDPEPFHHVEQVINVNRDLLPPGDNALVYPDPPRRSILSSIRLEAMREGIEDYELLALLAGKNPERANRLAQSAIPHINDYVREVAAFRNLQQQLLESF